MYYSKLLKEMIVTNRDAVTKMYLHEINMKWSNFLKSVDESEETGSNENMIKLLNEFIGTISNKKFHYNSRTRKGFPTDSPLFSSIYLDDLVSVFIKKNRVEKNKGIVWGYQKFSTNLQFTPESLDDTNVKQNLQQGESLEILQLTQTIENQYRVKGKRNFKKSDIVLPLLTFFNCNTLNRKQFINAEYYARLAKETFHKSKSIIICENLEDGFVPKMKSSNIDSVFVLRKQFDKIETHDICFEVVNLLEKRIGDYLFSTSDTNLAFQDTGIIE